MNTSATSLDRPKLGAKRITGLVLAGLYSLTNIPSALIPVTGEVGPPFIVLVLGSVLGVIGLMAVIIGWRTDHPAAHRIATGAVAISALTALPAFFVAGVPVLLRVMAGSSILLAIVIAVLLLAPTQRSRVPQPA
ncbi:hypothetical protein H5398_01000 [Tessaracoccus sp. MC1679]|uniref:hypothetical protein n=1 Tax=Tessaracoccus sp. MC1679 TaxID=2760313 RepID=UPI001601809A|nr:hypothetical protein [Tessaracoccus sp. MC1679]MBB1514559.1 hypothetical protein [Tessaracoccus sp. MC1679]